MAAAEIQMESAGEAEAPGRPGTEPRARKPSALCFGKRPASRKRAAEAKAAGEGDPAARCDADPGEAAAAGRSRSPRGAWAALKSLARPRRRQEGCSRRRQAPSAAGATSVEEAGARGPARRRGSSGCAMPCLRRPGARRRPSASEAEEESEGSAKAGDVAGATSAEPGEPVRTGEAEPPDQAPAGKSDQDVAAESAGAAAQSETSAEPSPGGHLEPVAPPGITQPAATSGATPGKQPGGSPHRSVDDKDKGEDASRGAAIAAQQPNGAVVEQEMAAAGEELPEGAEAGGGTGAAAESQDDDDAARPEPPEPPGPRVAGAGIVITVTPESDDDADSDAACEASPGRLPHGRAGAKDGDGGGGEAEDDGPGGWAAEQHELLLVETASSLVKAAIQASVEQLLNEMALEQHQHNSFL